MGKNGEGASVSIMLLRISVVLLSLFLLVGCAARDAKRDPSQSPRIGLSMDSFVVERWLRDRDIFVAEAQARGAQVFLQVANQDHNTQVSQINMLVNQGIDVLVVVPNDSARLGPMIRQVRDRGIPVISYDRLILGGGASLYIAHDHVRAGELMAEALVKKTPVSKEGRFVIVNGAANDHNSSLLNKGFHNVLDPLIAQGQVQIVTEINLQAWSSEEAENAFKDFLTQQKDFNGIIAGNDMLAESLIRVLSQRSRLDGVAISGMDADLAACQRVVEGSQTMTVYKPIGPLAAAAAKYAIKLAKHESLDVKETINDGTFSVPYVKLEPVAVDAKNMQDVIVKEGFHRSEEIYRSRKNK